MNSDGQKKVKQNSEKLREIIENDKKKRIRENPKNFHEIM